MSNFPLVAINTPLKSIFLNSTIECALAKPLTVNSFLTIPFYRAFSPVLVDLSEYQAHPLVCYTRGMKEAIGFITVSLGLIGYAPYLWDICEHEISFSIKLVLSIDT